jgi:hypothetical protein
VEAEAEDFTAMVAEVEVDLSRKLEFNLTLDFHIL